MKKSTHSSKYEIELVNKVINRVWGRKLWVTKKGLPVQYIVKSLSWAESEKTSTNTCFRES